MSTRNASTEELIARLAAAPAVAPFTPSRAALALLAAAAVGVALYLWSMGARPDLAAALSRPVTQAKTALPLLIVLFALPAALRLSRPATRIVLWPLALPVALAAALVLYALVATPPGQLLAAMIGHTSVKCLTSIAVLSLVPIAAGAALLRRGASTRPVLSGALIGLASGAAATAGYSLTCGEDSPLFYVTWYGLAILLMTALGAVVGARALKW